EKPVSIPQRRDTRKPRPPPDFVRNVVGSSAAAGSAEFHIFRNNRKREMDRLDYMNQKAQQEELDAEYNAKREKQMKLEEEKTAKKRLKRRPWTTEFFLDVVALICVDTEPSFFLFGVLFNERQVWAWSSLVERPSYPLFPVGLHFHA
ncbi:unnamed protein product, partial [Toxocara canis]|uniref:Cir_N domain-containing protein n=1 Tax=Toxocara canis TaxID=6265 RepID=A0A183U6Z8_TOXCA